MNQSDLTASTGGGRKAREKVLGGRYFVKSLHIFKTVMPLTFKACGPGMD